MTDAGKPMGLLEQGERKHRHGHRTVLVHGDPGEIEAVRLIFKLYVEDGLNRGRIARRLDALGIPTRTGARWGASVVRSILTNERYMGNLTYAKTAQKLKTKVTPNPPHMWVRAEGAVEPIVDEELFRRAQRIALGRSGLMKNDQIVARLKQLLAKHGKLSLDIMTADPELPSARVIRLRFGTTLKAYEAAGWDPPKRYRQILEISPLGGRISGVRLKALIAAGAFPPRHPPKRLLN